MTIQRLVPLTLGWQELDRCIALDGYPPGEGDRIPIPGWVIERERPIEGLGSSLRQF